MISNATPLVFFGSVARLDVLFSVYPKIEICKTVFNEVVVNGKEAKMPDAFLIEEAVKAGHIKVLNLSISSKRKAAFFLQTFFRIHSGEAETIALAFQLKRNEILLDEKIARKNAKILGLKPIGSLKVLLLAFKKKKISEKELREIVKEITSSKFFVSSQIMEEFWILFEKMKNKK